MITHSYYTAKSINPNTEHGKKKKRLPVAWNYIWFQIVIIQFEEPLHMFAIQDVC